jgi:hypothetical protein
MPKKPANAMTAPPEFFFVKELAGETPPTFAAMRRLYSLATDLFGLVPWQLLDESKLVLTRDSVSGELWYCSVMGSLGEVYSMHAYRGEEGLRLFRKMAAEKIVDPGEVLTSMDCLYVELVPRQELKRQDRELLAALGHPRGRNLLSPVFRAIRPGFHPWFVNAEEALTLAECIRAVVVICTAITNQAGENFWEGEGVYPLVTRADGAEPRYNVDLVKSVLPPELPTEPVKLPEELMGPLRGRDYALRGVMELGYTFSGAVIGKANERPSCAAIALAVDADSGIVYAPEVTDSTVAPEVALARVFLAAVQGTGVLPREVRVRSQQHKASFASLMESFGVKIRVMNRLPAAEQACQHLLEFLGGAR